VAEPSVAEPTPTPAPPSVRAVAFRVPMSALVGVVFLAMCESFIAASLPWGWLLFLVPAAIAVWVVRTRTTIDAQRVAARRVLRTHVLPWSRITSLRVADHAWVRAVLADGGEVALPAVYARHLPVLAVLSGGRLADPTATPTPAREAAAVPAPADATDTPVVER
jgi:hypothetical protein